MFGLPPSPAPAPYPVPTATYSTPAPVPAQSSVVNPVQRQLASLTRAVASLADHVSTTSGTPVPGIDLTSSQEDSLPGFIKASFKKKGYDVVVPDRIPQAESHVDRMWHSELVQLRGIKNSDGDRNPKRLREHMQTRFCPTGLDIVNIVNRGHTQHRLRMEREHMLQLRDYEEYLKVRLARNEAENRNLGDAITKREIESLKQREYELYGMIRTRYRFMLLSANDLRTILAGMTDAEDQHFVQATMGASSAQAQAMLKAMRKAGNNRKRKAEALRGVDANGGWLPVSRPRGGQGKQCFHCGARGKKYHVFTDCPEWLAGKPPAKGTRFAAAKAKGKKIPTPSKK